MHFLTCVVFSGAFGYVAYATGKHAIEYGHAADLAAFLHKPVMEHKYAHAANMFLILMAVSAILAAGSLLYGIFG